MLMAGVAPPDELIGAVPVTLVTVPTLTEPPKLTAEPLIVMLELVRLELPILVRVLVAPEIVLLVRIWLPVRVATVESIAIVPELVIVPPVKPVPAVMLVTVPPELGLVLVMVKLGYVPLVLMPVPPVKTTVWSGAVLVIVEPELDWLTDMPVPAILRSDTVMRTCNTPPPTEPPLITAATVTIGPVAGKVFVNPPVTAES